MSDARSKLMKENRLYHEELTRFAESLTRGAGGGLLSKARERVQKALFKVVRRAQTQYLTGGTPIHVRTGRLRASVRASQVTVSGRTLHGTVGTNVFYGRVLEYGAQTPGHIVRPVNIDPRTGKVFTRLHFRLGPYGAHGEAQGPWVSPKEVKIGPKPWLRPSLEDTVPWFLSQMARITMGSVREGGKKL